MDEPIHLSHSRLQMLARCPKQFEYVYVMGMRRPPDIALAIGRGVDASVNRNMLEKIGDRPGLPLDAVCDIATEAVGAVVEQDGLTLSPEELELGVKRVVGDAKDRAVRMASKHATEIAPLVRPTDVQKKFEVEIDSDFGPIEFIGYSDIVEVDHGMRDTKTSGKSPVANAAHSSMQLTAYATMSLVQDGFMPPELRLDTVVDTGKSAPRVVLQKTTRSRADMERYLERVRDGARLVKTGVFYPTDPSNWWCSKRWCGFWDICPHALRPAAVVVGGVTDQAEPDHREE